VTEATVTPAAGDAVSTPAPSSSTPAPEAPTQVQDTVQPTPEAVPGEPAAEQKAGEDDKGKKPNRIDAKERVQQAVRRQRLAERERDAALRRLAELEKPIRPENYDQLDFEARDTIRVREAVRDESAATARTEAERLEHERRDAWVEARDARNEAFAERLSEAEAQSPGLFDRFSRVPVTEDMAAFIAESELGVEIANYLSQPANRREVEMLNRLTDPRMQPSRDDLREADRILSRIEGRLSRAPQVRKATQAPNPGTTLGGGNPSPKGFDPATADEAAFSERYRQRMKARDARG
jgi:hypothetical protein